ncbi:putative TrmH family tRNA/rRNA methyltransferase [Austwickia sp. TVS 96-490-7B]|uniref:TrmH family RNA methyltransferase n=1 Tax=Austwickia sp. TVS 96-490-7B TaxID=2830843 RepID=UPI001C57640D|nr:RNA methyltransferase [Austwickia sp. TVS 96-490-7B]MBW3084340.1 putative TrmH family tRNA/rRNA methyltransferase [Austwickia sp. TVS 96-490-7B]
MPIQVTDPSDERLADYFTLTDVALRRRLDTERGLYLAESDKVIRRALAAGHRPRSYLMGHRWVRDLADLVADAEDAGIPVYVGDDDVITTMTGFHLHRGAIASMHRPEPLDVGELLKAVSDRQRTTRSRIAILDSLVDHTNVGACFRSAAAMGVDAVLITPRCADPFYRRAIRVSMGTVFQVPWTRIDPWPGGIDRLSAAGYVVAGMTLGEGAISLDELVAEDHHRLALVFGSEGHGLAPQIEKVLDRRVTIPMMGGVDSLNVAASSAVAFYATR